jgi:TM2 domain-containing membrane protein YozV
MYCKNCGRQIPDGIKNICSECESVLNTYVVNENEKFNVVKEVGNKENNTYQNSSYNDSNNQNYYDPIRKNKSKVTAGLLGIFLGAFGAHNFYLGYNTKAIIQLLITFFSCGVFIFIPWLWGLIEGILILTGSISKDADGFPLEN